MTGHPGCHKRVLGNDSQELEDKREPGTQRTGEEHFRQRKTVAKMDPSSESPRNGEKASMATTAAQEREIVGDVVSDLHRGRFCRTWFEFEF